METASPNPNPSPKQSRVCEECGLNPSKYRCPGCSIRSCSLPCVKSHKTRTSCTGKRPRTQFVPLSQFDNSLILSDYSLLEEAKTIADSARRKRDGLFGHFHFKLPFKLRGLKNAAARRNTHLLFLPTGMSKRDKNQSRYNFRNNFISWTIEWQFHSTDVVLIDIRVDENMSLFSVIEKHLKPGPWSNQLRPFYEKLDTIKFFIRKNAKDNKSPFRELDMKARISQQFANIVIVEYPVIHVFLPMVTFDFEIVKEIEPFSQKFELKEPVDDSPSPEGVPFREEEVEDDISDPPILDLKKCMNPELADNSRFTSFTRPLSKEPLMEHNDGHDISNSKEEQGVAENVDFGFEQDLKDAFSGLVGEANPDEFLDFDGFVYKGLMVDDELEEGEIPAF